MKQKNIFLFLGIFIAMWFLYIERSILTPFIVGGIFAYLFNPLISFFYHKCRLSRTIGIVLIYFLIIVLITFLGVIVIRQVSVESLDLNKIIQSDLNLAKKDANSLPSYLKTTVIDLLNNFTKSRFLAFFQSPYKSIVFSKAISEIISFFIFIFSGFYSLKDGEKGINKIINLFPEKIKNDLEELLGKINNVLGDYLRGEVVLILLIALVLYICLSILGLKFSLMISIFSGFAEIVPIIGPIVAGFVAVAIMLLTGSNNFGLNPINASIIIIIIYFVIRQIEDYIVVPHIMGKITKLNPFLIFFAVIAGGHLAGIIGLILAVPIIAVLRLLVIYFFDKSPLGKE